jgi:hypothetical protein
MLNFNPGNFRKLIKKFIIKSFRAPVYKSMQCIKRFDLFENVTAKLTQKGIYQTFALIFKPAAFRHNKSCLSHLKKLQNKGAKPLFFQIIQLMV